MLRALHLENKNYCFRQHEVCRILRDTRSLQSFGNALLRQIEDELPRNILRSQDSHRNREYEPNKTLDEKVRALLANLQLSVR